jgi:hypothetical protein
VIEAEAGMVDWLQDGAVTSVAAPMAVTAAVLN